MRRSFPVLAVTAVGAGVTGGIAGAVLALKAVANAMQRDARDNLARVAHRAEESARAATGKGPRERD